MNGGLYLGGQRTWDQWSASYLNESWSLVR